MALPPLPLTGLYPSMVAGRIGYGTTNYGRLQVNDNVNRWGFNSPDALQQAHVWGVQNPAPYYEIGAFRRYDHWWRCFSLYNIEIGGDLNTYGSGFLGFLLQGFPFWSESPGFQTIPHTFDVWMNRWANNWTPNQGMILISEGMTIYEDYHQKIDIDPLNPPDGFGPLSHNSTIYFLFNHKPLVAPEYDERWSSNHKDRRWDSGAWTPVTPMGGTGTLTKDPDGNRDAWIISIEIG